MFYLRESNFSLIFYSLYPSCFPSIFAVSKGQSL